jgi:Predicted Zn-dependent protease (DUF2268)
MKGGQGIHGGRSASTFCNGDHGSSAMTMKTSIRLREFTLLSSGSRTKALLVCLLALACASCGSRHIVVEFYIIGGYRFSQMERQQIEDVAEAAAVDARRHLPKLPMQLVLRVQPGAHVMAETGEMGEFVKPNVVIWTVDPHHRSGVSAIVRQQLRGALLHELHHLVRAETLTSTSLMDEVVAEGMATAFERDVGGVTPPWGTYPDDVAVWVKELLALPPTAPQDYWLYRHPDGRRWIGYRAGTYIVDKATRASGRSSASLVSVTTEDVIAMAAIRREARGMAATD